MGRYNYDWCLEVSNVRDQVIGNCESLEWWGFLSRIENSLQEFSRQNIRFSQGNNHPLARGSEHVIDYPGCYVCAF